MNNNLDRKKEILNEINILETEYIKIIKEEFPKRIKEIVAKHNRFCEYTWIQGTPSFRDGDICTFECYPSEGTLTVFKELDDDGYGDTVDFDSYAFSSYNKKDMENPSELYLEAEEIYNDLKEIFDDYRKDDYSIIFDDYYGLKVTIKKDEIVTEDYDYE
jgi:hypothetical protein